MRNHIFEPAEADGQYHIRADLEYINDYGPIFNYVCQIDEHTEKAFVFGAMFGYDSSWTGRVFIKPVTGVRVEDMHRTIPNKGWVGMWEENGMIFGLYRGDFVVYLTSVRTSELADALRKRGERIGIRFRSERLWKALEGTDYCRVLKGLERAAHKL